MTADDPSHTQFDPTCAVQSQQSLLQWHHHLWLSWGLPFPPPCLDVKVGSDGCPLVQAVPAPLAHLPSPVCVSDAPASSYQILFCLCLNKIKGPPAPTSCILTGASTQAALRSPRGCVTMPTNEHVSREERQLHPFPKAASSEWEMPKRNSRKQTVLLSHVVSGVAQGHPLWGHPLWGHPLWGHPSPCCSLHPTAPCIGCWSSPHCARSPISAPPKEESFTQSTAF